MLEEEEEVTAIAGDGILAQLLPPLLPSLICPTELNRSGKKPELMLSYSCSQSG